MVHPGPISIKLAGCLQISSFSELVPGGPRPLLTCTVGFLDAKNHIMSSFGQTGEALILGRLRSYTHLRFHHFHLLLPGGSEALSKCVNDGDN